MKKGIAVLLALAIGFAYYPSGAVAMAAGSQEKNAEIEVSKEKAAEAEENTDKTADMEDVKGKHTEIKENTAEDEECEEPSVEVKEKNSKSEEDTEKKEASFLNKLLGNFFGGEESVATGESSDKTQKGADEKSAPQETSALKNLQIPQKLDVVIDPWEIDKKGQVYSEQYTISNTGDTPGILTLSNLACRPRDKSGVIVRTDKEGLHDSGDKAIYMEMLFGNGEQIIFSQESSQYQKELKPGEELSIRFDGEVNENAFGKWESNDIAVSVVYSWEMEEAADTVAENQEDKILDDVEEIEEKIQKDSEREALGEEAQDDGNSEKSEKTDLNPEEPETDAEAGEPEGQQPGANEADKKPATDENETQEPPSGMNEAQEFPSEVNGLQEFSSNASSGVGTEQSKMLGNMKNASLTENLAENTQELQTSNSDSNSSGQEKNEIKNIDLLEPQQVDVSIDSWKTNGKGQIVSPEYLLHNTGNSTGIWTLSEIVCEPQEQSGVAIQKNKNDFHNGEGKSVYMELILGNGEKIILSQEKSQYKVELKPGERLSVHFVGEMNGNLFETREDGEITVTAVCTWELK